MNPRQPPMNGPLCEVFKPEPCGPAQAMDFKIVVICWPGVEANAQHIAGVLTEAGHPVITLYSTKDGSERKGPGHWQQVGDDLYYGGKFLTMVTELSFDVLLQIHADAFCEDWPALVQRCRSLHFANKNIGIWSPTPDNSAWLNPHVTLATIGETGLLAVAQTDCIVWSMNKTVATRLKGLNLSKNNLGWGIDWAAISFCYCTGHLVLRDTRHHIRHQPGTGYMSAEAEQQMKVFLEDLTVQEKVMHRMLSQSILVNRSKARQP